MNWFCENLDMATLKHNVARAIPPQVKNVVMLDVQTTGVGSNAHLWRIGLGVGATTHTFQIKLADALIEGSHELEMRVVDGQDRQEALDDMLEANKNGITLDAAIAHASVLQAPDTYVCCQTATGFAMPVLRQHGFPAIDERRIIDTGMLAKSAMIPTMIMDDESVPEFYKRVGSRRLYQSPYSIEKFVIPALVRSGDLVNINTASPEVRRSPTYYIAALRLFFGKLGEVRDDPGT